MGEAFETWDEGRSWEAVERAAQAAQAASHEKPSPGREPGLLRRIRQIEGLAGLARDLAIDLAWEAGDPRRGLRAPTSACAARIARLEELAGDVGQALRDLGVALGRRDACRDAPSVAGPSGDLRTAVDAYERRLIVSALRASGMKQVAAARLLGIPPTTLNEKLKRLGLRAANPPRPEAG